MAPAPTRRSCSSPLTASPARARTSGNLPDGPWRLLADWLTLQLPPPHQGEA